MAEKYQVLWTRSALSDLESIVEYIAGRGDTLNARKVYQKVMAKAAGLRLHPQRCRSVAELKEFGIREFREMIIAPYRVCFRHHARKVAIVAVLDSRRDVEELLIARALTPIS